MNQEVTGGNPMLISKILYFFERKYLLKTQFLLVRNQHISESNESKVDKEECLIHPVHPDPLTMLKIIYDGRYL